MGRAGPTVADVMTRKLLAVAPETSTRAALEMMLERRITGAPVIDPEGYPIGVISLTDLVDDRRAGTESFGFDTFYEIDAGEIVGRGTGQSVEGDRVCERMTREVVTVSALAPLRKAASLMFSRRIHRLLVVDGDRMLGILSSLDLARGLMDDAVDADAG